ncbi:16S rRNA (cytidine(1402)-2'-O)-methyltransferase [Cerasibacillus terrae]|uniref:Ribosomal RNA small subunit methyltransferase I n=1 Tax=Cerasibacillus terrae TaxID=2498845 RepID=A0A5C8NQA4_9BACI|nr:16S rRNA (cytidine(1402)-2'-O)-methyltransferase [Cerasibacillus terrae]TXL63428.1 16S rRNA (cytidine(1402)-2'-O)-methyltransferase [Cerasibacillus terrae]
MNNQKSFVPVDTGTLYVVPTPIGNLEDITLRALNILKAVSLIAAEDTRNTKKLLNHFEITTPLISYHEHSKKAKEQLLIEKLLQGEEIALVSDAGMPAISDPGSKLIQEAIQEDIPIVVLPGANAALCALVGSGLPTKQFLFYGFLPRKKKEKKEELERLMANKATLLFYESPYRVKDTIKVIEGVFGGETRIALVRELTKRFEEYIRGTVEEVLAWIEEHELKGECCIVLENNNDQQNNGDLLWWSNLSITEHVDHYVKKGSTKKNAIKQVAIERKLPKREVYQTYHFDA